MKVPVGIIVIPSAFLRMLPAQVDAHPFIEEVLEFREIAATITVVKVAYPSPNLLIELPNDHLWGELQVFPTGQHFDLRLDPCHGLPRRWRTNKGDILYCSCQEG